MIRPLRFSLLAWFATTVLSPAFAPAQTTLVYPPAPVPVDEVVARMKLPDGFRATLFAAEPDVVQPIAFTFDDRGRMWVAECLSYPKWTKDGTGRDRIVILEDTDGDGRHDVRKVFADNLANLSGLELGFGGVYICSLPALKFIPDRDGDDRADGPAETLLDGWDENCRHNVFNGLAWGPDGWLYGLNGILSRSLVGPPGAAKEDRKYLDCGVWRYHPTRREFEPVVSGTTNPWGLDWDEYGEMFITNCVIKHLFHVTPGGHYDRMFGADPNTHVYKLMPSCADHIHWAGGHWTDSRGAVGAHSDAGGGHAHSGCSIYLGDNFPPEYRNNVFMCNIHGNRVNRDRLERTGSGYTAHHENDFLFANDPWHRGLTVKYGPDGGLYVADWCDTGECHNYDVADVSNGRIVKVMYERRPRNAEPAAPEKSVQNRRAAGVSPRVPLNLASLSDQELFQLHSHENEWYVRHARRVLQERAAAGPLKPETIALFRSMFREDPEPLERLKALWTLHVVGAATDDDYLAAIRDKSADVRGWGVTLACERPSPRAEKGRFLAAAVSNEIHGPLTIDKSPRVRMKLASAAQRLTDGEGHSLAAMLAASEDFADDEQLALMVWYATQAAHARRMAGTETKNEIVDAMVTAPLSNVSLVRRFAARHWVLTMHQAPNTPDKIFEMLLGYARTRPSKAEDIFAGMLEALKGTRDIAKPASWESTYAVLRESPSLAVRADAKRLAVLFGDPAVLAEAHAVLMLPSAPIEERREALELLLGKRVRDLPAKLLALLDDGALRRDALRGLAAYDDKSAAALILAKFATFDDGEKADALQTLAARPAYALALLDAVEQGRLDRREVPSGVAMQIAALKNKAVAERLAKVWGAVRPTSQARLQQAERLKQVLAADAVAKADPAQGRTLFTKHCAACHKLFNDGGKIGPELTGSQRANVDYILENVLDPSAKVGRLYQVTILELTDGRIVQGVVVDENDLSVTVQTSNEQFVVPKSDIDRREQTKLSLMPEGLFDKLSDEELRALMAYLAK
jgi:putative membrane-bound dehydrogenase-like protein